jgi:hypothetical protein
VVGVSRDVLVPALALVLWACAESLASDRDADSGDASSSSSDAGDARVGTTDSGGGRDDAGGDAGGSDTASADVPSGGPACTFDTRTFVDLGGQTWESITANGTFYNFIGPSSTPDSNNGADLTTVARFAQGPCAGKPILTCVFDTRAFVTLSGDLWESITAYGKYWNFIGTNATPDPNNGADLTSVTRFAQGPCTGKAAGNCVFDTRAFVTLSGQVWESITAYGKYWNFIGPNATPDPLNGADLTTVTRFAQGPCAGKAAGTCVFDTRAFATLGGQLWESITAYGKYWNFIGPNATPDPNNGQPLGTVARYAGTICH